MERQDHPTGTMPPYHPEYAAQPESDETTRAHYPGHPGHQWTAPPPAAGQQYVAQQPARQPYGAQPPTGPPYPPQPAGEPERPKWSTRKTTAVTAVAAAAVLAIGGVAVAHSGSDSGSSTSQGPGGGFGGPGGTGGGPGGGALQGTGLTGALHGTFVTGSDGSYVTRVMQTGQVTAVSSTSITVKSTDGYTKSYSLSSSTTVNGGQSQVSAIETGHTVTVIAAESGAASTVTDQSLATTGQNGQGGLPGAGTGGAPGQGTTGQGTTGQGTTGTT
jgi:hypothetical protein